MPRVAGWIDAIFVDLARQMRWSYLPPLMVYFAAGCSGLTLIVGTFFVKDYLDFTAAEVAALAFWAGLPWALKMPLGHLVDLIWRWKGYLVWFGASLIALSVGIMVLVMTRPDAMTALMPLELWYATSFILSPCGLVVQDAVADAMSIDAVPLCEADGTPISDHDAKVMHTTMQTLGRFALIGGTVVVALVNIAMFSGIESLNAAQKADIYASIYTGALAIPVISVSGVALAAWQKRRALHHMRTAGLSDTAIAELREGVVPQTRANPWYFIGGALFLMLTLAIGLGGVRYGQEIIFAGSMAVVLLLMRQLVSVLTRAQARTLIGTAIIIFVFRAVPLPGEGLTWFNIDVLGFDQQFLSVLSLITSALTLVGLLVLRPLMAERRIVWIVVMLTLAAGLLALPNIGLYYGVHEWTAALTEGVVDARFIAILDTAAESPLGQIAMIPMLAWIARSAPRELKATFFAVMASFTNLALSAAALLTRYLNEVFIVSREVRDASDEVITQADYSQLGVLLMVVAGMSVAAPLLTIWLVQKSRLRTDE